MPDTFTINPIMNSKGTRINPGSGAPADWRNMFGKLSQPAVCSIQYDYCRQGGAGREESVQYQRRLQAVDTARLGPGDASEEGGRRTEEDCQEGAVVRDRMVQG